MEQLHNLNIGDALVSLNMRSMRLSGLYGYKDPQLLKLIILICASLLCRQIKYPKIWQQDITRGKLFHLPISSSHFTTFNTSPPPSLTETQILKQFCDFVITLCVAIGWIYDWLSWKCLFRWHEDVGSNVCCHLLLSQCFPLSSARPPAVSLILSALRVRDLGTFYRGHKGVGRWWCYCNLILSKLQGSPRGRDTDQQTTVRNLGWFLVLCEESTPLNVSSYQLQEGCGDRPETLLKSPWVRY